MRRPGRGARARRRVTVLGLAAWLLASGTGCRHAEPRPAWGEAEGAPAWRVLYGAGKGRKGSAGAPECRVGADGQQVCGHHCRTGRDGRVACAATPEGTCELRPDGRASCVDPPPAAPAPP